ncbi:hypothetical protein HDU98_007626 [Podochytrium sp. JEL0797]|nr:hypothetical protein HDU98_007626 [Podochytrium sp. JEL0797]
MPYNAPYVPVNIVPVNIVPAIPTAAGRYAPTTSAIATPATAVPAIPISGTDAYGPTTAAACVPTDGVKCAAAYAVPHAPVPDPKAVYDPVPASPYVPEHNVPGASGAPVQVTGSAPSAAAPTEVTPLHGDGSDGYVAPNAPYKPATNLYSDADAVSASLVGAAAVVCALII